MFKNDFKEILQSGSFSKIGYFLLTLYATIIIRSAIIAGCCWLFVWWAGSRVDCTQVPITFGLQDFIVLFVFFFCLYQLLSFAWMMIQALIYALE